MPGWRAWSDAMWPTPSEEAWSALAQWFAEAQFARSRTVLPPVLLREDVPASAPILGAGTATLSRPGSRAPAAGRSYTFNTRGPDGRNDARAASQCAPAAAPASLASA